MKHDNLVLTTCVMVALAGLLLSCQREEQQKAEELIRPVRSQQVFLTGSNRVRTFSGTAKAGLEAKLSFKVSGTIARLHVQVGDKVRAGQRIAELDPEDYELKAQRAQSSLARAQAAARNAAANYKRIQALYENRNASRNDLDAARADAESSRAEVNSSKKELELERLHLRYTKLAAPAACSVATVPVEMNENVGPGQPIVEVVCGSKLEVEVAVPEVFIARIQKGSPVTATFDAIPGIRFPAIVTKVGVASGQTATTFPVTVQLQREVPEFRSGMAAEVTFRFVGQEGRARMLVPPVAVGEDRDGRFVFVVEKTDPGFGIVRRKPVTVGELTPEGLEILGGLADGERVVTAGVRRLQGGRKVQLMESSGALP